MTGLSGAGKTTLAQALCAELNQRSMHAVVLDGDDMRSYLNSDLGYSDADRSESTRRTSEVARLLVLNDLIAIVSLISPFRSDRDRARQLFKTGCFIEVFISTPLSVCEKRDPKGHYKRARAGELRNFTGIESSYQEPVKPEVIVGAVESLELSLVKIMKLMPTVSSSEAR